MKNILSLLIMAALVLSCKSNKTKVESKEFVPLKMVVVPAMITQQQEKTKYIIDHFWDGMNFRDTSYLAHTQNLFTHFGAYLNYLSTSTMEIAKLSIKNLIDSAIAGDPKITDYFKKVFAIALYDPNSITRNEELYIVVLEQLINSDKISDSDKIQLQYQLDLAYRNRLGTKAIDFNYVLENGKESSLYKTSSEFTILMFIDPDCHNCKKVMEQMKLSSVLSENSKKVKVLTIYAGDNFNRWLKEVPLLNKNWINGCDKEMKLMEGPLYDLRPTPSLYLLDKNKIVILKDAPFETIEDYLKNR